jgi:hypothetical protein
MQIKVWYNATLTGNSTSLTGDVFGRDVVAIARGLDEAISTCFLLTVLTVN